jgi:hypothetical protein
MNGRREKTLFFAHDQSLPRSLDPKRKVLHPLSTAAVITCRFSVHTQTVFLAAAAAAHILMEGRRDEADANNVLDELTATERINRLIARNSEIKS